MRPAAARHTPVRKSVEADGKPPPPRIRIQYRNSNRQSQKMPTVSSSPDAAPPILEIKQDTHAASIEASSIIEHVSPTLVEVAKPKETIDVCSPSLMITEVPISQALAPAVEQSKPSILSYSYTCPRDLEHDKSIQLSTVAIPNTEYNCIVCVFNAAETRYDTDTHTLHIATDSTLRAGIRLLLKEYSTTPGIYFGEAGSVALNSEIIYYESQTDSGFWLSTYALKILLGVYSRTVFNTIAFSDRTDIKALLSNHGITPAQI